MKGLAIIFPLAETLEAQRPPSLGSYPLFPAGWNTKRLQHNQTRFQSPTSCRLGHCAGVDPMCPRITINITDKSNITYVTLLSLGNLTDAGSYLELGTRRQQDNSVGPN